MNTEDIILKFKNYLEENSIIVPPSNENIDLYSFYKALTELKTETKRSSRQVQASLVNFKEAFALMEKQFSSQEEMKKSLADYHSSELIRTKNDHVLELIDCHDRIERNINESHHLFFKLKKRWFSSSIYKKALGLSQGMKLSLEHINHTLAKKGAKKIETLGLIFNPKFMKIAEVEFNHGMKNLVVLEEVITGYIGKDNQVIRYAEVIVNKHQGN